MVRPDGIYKIETKGDGVILCVCVSLRSMRSKPLTELQRTYFERDSLPKRLLSRFYYNTSPGIRKSSEFASQNCRHHGVSLGVVHLRNRKTNLLTINYKTLQIIFGALKNRCNQIGTSRAYSTPTLGVWHGEAGEWSIGSFLIYIS
jgi:hypothetical protein